VSYIGQKASRDGSPVIYQRSRYYNVYESNYAYMIAKMTSFKFPTTA